MLLRRALMAAIAFVLLVPAASAQNYPDHSVKIIVPVGPAGSYDLLGRLVADQLTKRHGAVVRCREPARRRQRHRHPVGRRQRRRMATRCSSAA